jgi:methylase of polypeptide subunit release factors
LDVAKINIENNNYNEKIKLLKSDLLSYYLVENTELKVLFKSKRLIITANLPYVKDLDYENMDFAVINYEPDIALYG